LKSLDKEEGRGEGEEGERERERQNKPTPLAGKLAHFVYVYVSS